MPADNDDNDEQCVKQLNKTVQNEKSAITSIENESLRNSVQKTNDGVKSMVSFIEKRLKNRTTGSNKNLIIS